jgi:hypothetical protein
MKSTFLTVLLLFFTAILYSQPEHSSPDSILAQLTGYKWTTCGHIDSVNQHSRIQLINKALLQNVSNCTANGAADSEWIFSIASNQNLLMITNRTGWMGPAEFVRVSTMKWRWKFNPETRLIELYEYKDSPSFQPPEKLKVRFYLLVMTLSEINLVLACIPSKSM